MVTNDKGVTGVESAKWTEEKRPPPKECNGLSIKCHCTEDG